MLVKNPTNWLYALLFCSFSFVLAQELDLSDFNMDEGEKKQEKKESAPTPSETPSTQASPTPMPSATPSIKTTITPKPQTTEPPLEMPETPQSDFGAKQVQIKEDRSTRHITLSGTVGMYYLYRDRLFSDALFDSDSTSLSGDFFDPRVSLQFDIEMDNNIKAVIELRNNRREENFIHTSSGDLYLTNRSSDDQFQFEFQKAYLEVNHFLFEGLKFKTGIIPQKYALRADGQAFFLNLGESESPFSTRANTHAAGAVFSYKPVQMLEFYADAFYLVTSESGFQRRDETIAGINLDLYLPKTVQAEGQASKTLVRFFNLILAAIQGDNEAPLWNVGFGFDYFLSGDPNTYLVEAYGEALFQFGKYHTSGRAPFVPAQDKDHLAFGGYAGIRFSYEASDYRPFADISAWYISGDDNDPSRDKNNDLVTYEDVRSTLIMEDRDYGLDVDSNYWAVKFKTGIHLAPIVKEEMRLEVLYAYFQAIDAAVGRSKRMGDEVDIRLTWEYSSDLVFSLAAGFLMNSRYLQNVLDDAGGKGKQNTFIVRFETMLRF